NWVDSNKASPEDQAAWTTSMAGLKEHEQGHADINREEAQKLNNALPGTTGVAVAPTSTEAYKKAGAQLTQKLNQKVKSNAAENSTRQQQYDKRTDHGRKQHDPQEN